MNNADRELMEYCRDYWEFVLRENPTFATYIGDHRYDDRVEDLSGNAIARRTRYFEGLLTKVNAFEKKGLDRAGKLNQRLLRESLVNRIGLSRCGVHYLPVDQLGGPHIDFPQIVEYQPLGTRQEIGNYLQRIAAFPRQIDQAIENLREGVRKGITAYRRSIDAVMEQIGTFLRYTPEEHPLCATGKEIGHTLEQTAREKSRSEIIDAVSSHVLPAYEKLFRYLSGEYRHQCRNAAGIWSLPDGDEMYRFHVKYRTTTDRSPEEIHETGRHEVARIGRAIETVMEEVGFSGHVRDFAAHLEGKRELYHRDRAAMIAEYREILGRMEETLPGFFGQLPRATYDLKEIEPYRERAAPAAYYYPPPADFSRPGYFYVNTFAPERRPRFEMEALAFHEAVPGHHLQMALMQELEGIPDFRRFEGSTAFIEGWALYAEKLAGEMGFYQDPYSLYGRLSFELWRAIRLVIDTGIHHYRWERDEAMRYCRENSGVADGEIEVEVDRYIVLPGQALAYKIGELSILGQRERAAREHGAAFDIKAFHDLILGHGAPPLSVLSDVITEWLEGSRG